MTTDPRHGRTRGGRSKPEKVSRTRNFVAEIDSVTTIAGLTARQRAIWTVRNYRKCKGDKCTYEELAELFGCSRQAAYTSCKLAQKKIEVTMGHEVRMPGEKMKSPDPDELKKREINVDAGFFSAYYSTSANTRGAVVATHLHGDQFADADDVLRTSKANSDADDDPTAFIDEVYDEDEDGTQRGTLREGSWDPDDD